MGVWIDSPIFLPVVAGPEPVPRLKRDSGRFDVPPFFGGSTPGGKKCLIEKAAFAIRSEPSRHRRHSGHEVNK